MAKLNKKTKIAALTAALVIGASGTAVAYWTMTGGGSGTADAGTTIPVVVNQTNGAITDLYPGGPVKALSGTFTNDNAGPVTVGKVSATVTAASGTCNKDWYVIEGADPAASHVLGTGTGGTWGGLTVKMTNDAANQDACKLATITITYTVAVPVA